MTKNEMLSEKYALLRCHAEDRIKKWPNSASHSFTDLHRIIHELKIHLAEQEILNEELMKNGHHDDDEENYESGSPLSGPAN